MAEEYEHQPNEVAEVDGLVGLFEKTKSSKVPDTGISIWHKFGKNLGYGSGGRSFDTAKSTCRTTE